MNKIIIFFVLVCSFSHADTYKVAAYEWPPFIDSKRDDQGLAIELVRQALRTQGHEVDVVGMPWVRALTLLDQNGIDILPSVWFSEDRAKNMFYSETYMSNRLVFVKLKGSDYEFEGLPSLYDKVVGVIRDYGYEESFLADKNIQFSITDSLNSNVRKLLTGRIDLTISDEAVAKASIMSEYKGKVAFTRNALSESPLYVTCSKKNPLCPDIIESFNLGLEIMRQDGSLERLLEHL